MDASRSTEETLRLRLDTATRALNEATEDLARHERLAAECEARGDMKRADRYRMLAEGDREDIATWTAERDARSRQYGHRVWINMRPVAGQWA